VGGCQTDGTGSFPRTKECFRGTKIHLFEFGVKILKYLNFGPTYLSFGALYLSYDTMYLSFGTMYLNFGAQN